MTNINDRTNHLVAFVSAGGVLFGFSLGVLYGGFAASYLLTFWQTTLPAWVPIFSLRDSLLFMSGMYMLVAALCLYKSQSVRQEIESEIAT